MVQENKHLEYKDKSLIFKKYVLYIDVIIKEGSFNVGQKLNSFFGQIGIFENTEEIMEYIQDYYKSILLKNYVFNDYDLKEQTLDGEFIVYLPLTLIFYYGEKKVDFYVYSSWSKNFFDKNIRFVYIKNFCVLNSYKNLILKNVNFYKKIIEYNKLILLINNSYLHKFNAFNKKMLLNFFIMEDLHVIFFDEYLDFFFKKNNRLFFFKKIKLKNKKLLLSLNKNIFNIDLKFVIYNLLTKLSFFDNDFDDFDILNSYLTFVSNLYNFKLNFLKRFRRKKRFKKKIVKNAVGKKFVFFKIFNSIEDLKKKKKKR